MHRRKRRRWRRLCVSLWGSWPSPFRDRRIDAATRFRRGEGGLFSFLVFLLFFFRSGQERRATITSWREGTRRITMTERTMTVRKSSNCASPIYFSSYKRHAWRVLVESLHQYFNRGSRWLSSLFMHLRLMRARFFSFTSLLLFSARRVTLCDGRRPRFVLSLSLIIKNELYVTHRIATQCSMRGYLKFNRLKFIQYSLLNMSR